MKINKKIGFTLIELLVVIFIIGLLSSIVLSSLNTVRAKARSAILIYGAKETQKALLFYFDKNNGVYPPHIEDHGLRYTSISGATTEAIFLAGVTPTYLKELSNPGTFTNADMGGSGTSRLLYRRLTNNTVPGCLSTLNNCHALLFYTETSTVFGPANTAVYFISNGEIRNGFDSNLY